MKEKSEKKRMAQELLMKVPPVRLTRIGLPSGSFRDNICVCVLNGHFYIKATSVVIWQGGAFFRTKKAAGEIDACEAIPVRVEKRNVLSWIVSENTVRRLADTIDALNGQYMGPVNDFLDRLLECARQRTEEIGHYTFSKEEMESFHSLYNQRLRLLAEDKKEKKNRPTPDLPVCEDDTQTLHELVGRIESMGWEVTLRRKNSGDI